MSLGTTLNASSQKPFGIRSTHGIINLFVVHWVGSSCLIQIFQITVSHGFLIGYI